ASREHVQRGTLPGARLGERERAVREAERRERAPGDGLVRLLPVEASGDHQVERGVKPALERHHDALAEPRDPECFAAFERLERRLGGAQQVDARDLDALERDAADAALELLDVDGEVGDLGHRALVRSPASYFTANIAMIAKPSTSSASPAMKPDASGRLNLPSDSGCERLHSHWQRPPSTIGITARPGTSMPMPTPVGDGRKLRPRDSNSVMRMPSTTAISIATKHPRGS